MRTQEYAVSQELELQSGSSGRLKASELMGTYSPIKLSLEKSGMYSITGRAPHLSSQMTMCMEE